MTAEQVPESASPALAQDLGEEIALIYQAAETDLIRALAARARTAIEARDTFAAMLNAQGQVHRDTSRILARLDREAAKAVERALKAAYGRGGGRELLRSAGTIRNAALRLAQVRDGMNRWAQTLWQRLTGLASTTDPVQRRQLMSHALQQEAGRGVTLYAPGRRSAVALATEITQHAAGGAAIDGWAEALTDDGRDLVIVTESPHPCPICKPWEHKVLSISGLVDDRPSLAEARAGGLFHPRCHHTLFPWEPGFRWPPNSITHRPGTYDQVQRQRTLERHIREWKRREAAALDDITRAQARRKVRDWQSALRQHVDRHGLQRSRQRERIDYGHTRPLRHGLAGESPRTVEPKLPDRRRSALDDVKAVAANDGKARHETLHGGQSAKVEKVTLPDGRTAVHKTPRPGYDDPDDVKFLMDGEELAAMLGEAVGAPVAKTYRDRPDSVWVEWIDGTQNGTGKLIDSREGKRIGLLDALTGYGDRNLMVRDGKLVAFDHGGSWLQAELGDDRPHLADESAPMRHFVSGDDWRDDPPITVAEIDAIRKRIERLRSDFARLGRLGWFTYTMNALEQIRRRAQRRA
jgi:Phage minor capsid protein 2